MHSSKYYTGLVSKKVFHETAVAMCYFCASTGKNDTLLLICWGKIRKNGVHQWNKHYSLKLVKLTSALKREVPDL